MKRRCLPVFLFLMMLAIPTLGQGGKAEPLEIKFAKGSSSATLTGTLSTDQEMEYRFNAQKGQTVSIRNKNPGLFDVRIFSEENDVETEFDSSPVFSLTLPESGDYNLFIRKKAVARPRRAKFAVSISIK
jgi:hypothetical protein